MCAQPVSQTINCGVPSTSASFRAVAQDDCGVVTVRYSSTGATTFTNQAADTANMNVGSSVVTATATDGSGKTATCTTPVTITAGK